MLDYSTFLLTSQESAILSVDVEVFGLWTPCSNVVKLLASRNLTVAETKTKEVTPRANDLFTVSATSELVLSTVTTANRK